MKRWKFMAVGAALLFVCFVALVETVPVVAGERGSSSWTKYPGNVQFGDNSGRDTIDISGFVEVDSTATLNNALVTVLAADSASIDTLIVDSWAAFAMLTVNGNLTVDGGAFTADSANIDSLNIGSHLTAVAVTATGLGTFAGVTVDGGVLAADSARVTDVYSTGLTATGTVTGATVEMETLSVGNEEALIPMVFQADSLGVAQTIALWTWPRDYQLAKVTVSSVSAVDDTAYLEVLMDTLGGTNRDSVMIGGTGKALAFTPVSWLEAETEGCTLRTFLGSGTKGGLKANIILWLKLR